jgi:hypothetical protein
VAVNRAARPAIANTRRFNANAPRALRISS